MALRRLFPFVSCTTLLAVMPRTNADCPCGYTVLSGDHQAVFTEVLETDFLHVHDFEDVQDVWVPQAYNVSQNNANPWGKAAEYGNVVANGIEDPYSWSGAGELGQDPGLQLWTRSTLLDNSLVPMAEIVSARTDILYGSFRIGMKTTAINGTCGAFFFYFNYSTEIDMEFLSKQPNTVNLVIQSPSSAAQGYASGADFRRLTLPFAPDEEYNEFRFDWVPGRVEYFANSVWLATITENVPNIPGKIHVSHWSNGNEGWSAGPPEQDAVLTVSYVKAYFNSSDEERTGTSLEECGKAVGGACKVPDQTVPPDPTGSDGNETGKTFFITPQTYGMPSGNTTLASSATLVDIEMRWRLGWVAALLGILHCV